MREDANLLSGISNVLAGQSGDGVNRVDDTVGRWEELSEGSRSKSRVSRNVDEV